MSEKLVITLCKDIYNTLGGYKSGKQHVKNRGKYLLGYEDSFKTADDSKYREKELANELKEHHLVVGGH